MDLDDGFRDGEDQGGRIYHICTLYHDIIPVPIPVSIHQIHAYLAFDSVTVMIIQAIITKFLYHYITTLYF